MGLATHTGARGFVLIALTRLFSNHGEGLLGGRREPRGATHGAEMPVNFNNRLLTVARHLEGLDRIGDFFCVRNLRTPESEHDGSDTDLLRDIGVHTDVRTPMQRSLNGGSAASRLWQSARARPAPRRSGRRD